MTRKMTVRIGVGAAVVVAIVCAAVVGLSMFTRGNITKARQIALRLQASALANPNPVATAAAAAQPAATGAAGAPSASTAAGPAASKVLAATSAKAATGAKGSSTSPAAPPAPSAAAAKSSKTVSSVASAPASKAAPWRQPSAAEVNEAISAVHSLVPFFTPTPTDIATTGIQVCTALNQGQSYAQVQADALDMVGAGSYASYIPSSVPAVAIQTLVALFCPANAAKLA